MLSIAVVGHVRYTHTLTAASPRIFIAQQSTYDAAAAAAAAMAAMIHSAYVPLLFAGRNVVLVMWLLEVFASPHKSPSCESYED